MCFAACSTTARTMPAFLASRSSRLIPGWRARPEVTTTMSRAGRVGVVVRAGDPGVVPDDRGRLGEVEALALRQALDDVDEDDVGQAGLGDALRGRRADVAGADDGDLVAGHAEWGLLSGRSGARHCRPGVASSGRRSSGRPDGRGDGPAARDPVGRATLVRRPPSPPSGVRPMTPPPASPCSASLLVLARRSRSRSASGRS